MSDGAFSDRLSQLKARWESDPTSRVFLQLAEEYRHQGRVRDALAVLDKGLGEHPGYLSALVAKGRCHLELGEGAAARTALERVVKQDPTQMVANKLLVRAYLDTGEPDRARERLDLYSLLNDSDPEIGDLRRQIKLMDRPKEPVHEDLPFDLGPASPPMPAAPELFLAAPAVAAAPSAPIAPLDDIFDLGPKAAPAATQRQAAADTEDIFGFGEPAAPPAPAAASVAAPAAVTSPTPGEAVAEPVFDLPMPEMTALDETNDGDLFPGLTSRSNRHRYLESLESEGIFELGPVPEPASEVPPPLSIPAAFAMAPFAPPDLTPVEPPLPEVAPILEDPFDLAPAPPAVEEVEDIKDVEEADWINEAPALESTPLPDLEPLPEPVFGERSGPVLPEIDDLEDPDWSPPPSQEPEPAATATLGELYLRQGHTAEAERIFREVLEREPDNTGARAGLEQLGATEEPEVHLEQPQEPEEIEAPAAAVLGLDARQLLSGFRSGGGTTARKIFLLNRYLERIRGSRHVS